MIAGFKRTPEDDVDVLVEVGVAVLGRAAACQQPLPPRPSHIVFNLAHQAVDFDHYFFLAVNVPEPTPAMSRVPFMDVALSTVPL